MEIESGKLIGKNIRLILKNNFHYRGLVFDSEAKGIWLRDKYGNSVFISVEDISLLEVLE